MKKAIKKLSFLGIMLVSLVLAACNTSEVPEETLTALETFICTTTINGTTKDVVVVPNNATCTLNNTSVQGNIIVNTGATLVARGVVVDGNIQSEGHRRVTVVKSTLRKSRVGGSVQIVQGKNASVLDTIINGSLQVEQNNGLFNFSRNTIGSDLQAFSNTGTGLTISRNVIDGNLQCKSNVPAPIGSGNIAASKQDQCANL
jgi:hypothetical protein